MDCCFTPDGQVYAVGQEGLLLQWDRTAWKFNESGLEGADAWGYEVVCLPSGDVFALFATGPWEAPDGSAVLQKGSGDTTWSRIADPPGVNTALWGFSPYALWTTGTHGNAYKWTGVQWQLEPTGAGTPLTTIVGSSGTDIYAFGNDCMALHRDEFGWWRFNLTGCTGRWISAWMDPENTVFALPSLPSRTVAIGTFERTAWASVEIDTAGNWYSLDISGTSASDLFVVGATGTSYPHMPGVAFHFNGSGWENIDIGRPYGLTGVCTRDVTGEAYAVGIEETLVRIR